VRWRLQRASLSPEEAGLCGCWQFVAVWREQKNLRKSKVMEEFEEYSFYCTSAARGQYTAQQLLEFIRGHWAASENGAHYRRDVSLGEDASQISGRTGAFVMATLRNLLLGLFELQKHRGQTQEPYFPGWRRSLTSAQKLRLITQPI
jgi:predicted transposase YbfD/YdcC